MIRNVEITDGMRDLARGAADFYGAESRKPGKKPTVTWGEDSFFIGFLGELVVRRYLGLPLQKEVGYIDAAHDLEINGAKVDVKTSRLRWPVDQLTSGYMCYVPATQRLEGIDAVVFVRLSPDLRTGHIFGFVPKGDLGKFARIKDHKMAVPAYSIPPGSLEDIDALRAAA